MPVPTEQEIYEGTKESIARSQKFRDGMEVEHKTQVVSFSDGRGNEGQAAIRNAPVISGKADRRRDAEVRNELEELRRGGSIIPAVLFSLMPSRIGMHTGQTGYFSIPGTQDELEPTDVPLDFLGKDFAVKYKGVVSIRPFRGPGIDYPCDMRDKGDADFVPKGIPPKMLAENFPHVFGKEGFFVVEFLKGPPGEDGQATYSAPLELIEKLIEKHSKDLEEKMLHLYRKGESAWAQSNHDAAAIEPAYVAAVEFLFKRGRMAVKPVWASATRSNISEFSACYACGENIASKAIVCSKCSRVQPRDADERGVFENLLREGFTEPAVEAKKRADKKPKGDKD